MLLYPAGEAAFGQFRDWLDHVTGNEQEHPEQTNVPSAFIHSSPRAACTCKMHQKGQKQEDRGYPGIAEHVIWEHAPFTVLALSLSTVL